MPTIKVKYQKIDDAVIWRNPVAGKDIIFQATNITQQKTGIHARVSLLSEQAVLGWSFFNVERSEERTRLANSAFTRLSINGYSKEDLRYDLDAFCVGLWDYLISQFTPEIMAGEERIGPPEFLLELYLLADGGIGIEREDRDRKFWIPDPDLGYICSECG